MTSRVSESLPVGESDWLVEDMLPLSSELSLVSASA